MSTEDVQKALTYGEKQVGLTFNPSNNPIVDRIKTLSAALVDEINDQRSKAMSNGAPGEVMAQYTLGIRAAEEASFRGVKAATWQY